ncbi:MAG: hypothetical protein AAGC65_03240, partial [Mucilaginibacter sp.]|uniref:hypothetical protein n=1 Tax=Mucilaginibacter sp. TaxID=1882438 RepID=UPI0031A5AC16
MNKFTLLLLTFTLFLSTKILHAQQTDATITGKVITKDNKPAEAVSVGLAGTTKGAMTNHKGVYTITR